ncbi:MAG: DUF2461 domain-containing protein [Alistipes sp.]|jgi:uncharacterized protein (TIGR02453 family)|nr:DUF2461 domain-containing protein [Alistipes sp.]
MMKDIINFLEDLAANNDRAWFEANRDRYKAVKSRMDAVAKDFIEAVAAFDPSVEGVQVKDATYRIYRDTRFTKDKSPYKTWFGVYVCPRGKRSGLSGYYMHVEPDQNHYMLCTGAYCPTAGEIKSVREEIMTEGDAFVETIRQAEGFDIDWSTAYKRMPQGWSAEDPHSEYYRLRNFLLVKLIDRDFVLSDDFISRAADQMSRTRPFNDTLNRAIEYAREMGW